MSEAPGGSVCSSLWICSRKLTLRRGFTAFLWKKGENDYNEVFVLTSEASRWHSIDADFCKPTHQQHFEEREKKVKRSSHHRTRQNQMNVLFVPYWYLKHKQSINWAAAVCLSGAHEAFQGRFLINYSLKWKIHALKTLNTSSIL